VRDPRGRQELGIGSRVLVDGVQHLVIGVTGANVRLAGQAGAVLVTTVAEMLSDPRFDLVDIRARPQRRGDVGVAGLPAEAVEQARWWETHIAEVVYGLPPEAPAGSRSRRQYDPELTSLSAREQAKACELKVSVNTLKHRRQRWEAHGLQGLVDLRTARRKDPAGRVHPAVAEAMRRAIGEATDDSSRTAAFIIWRSGEILRAEGTEVAMPSQRTCYRLFDRLSKGQHTTGSAATRRSLAGRPQGMFSSASPAAPGELMEIDSTPLDVLVELAGGVAGRVELTGMIDVATRTVTAAVLCPTTKAMDASLLLARSLTPEPMRPGWIEALSLAASVLPYERLLSIDERLEHAAARPVIIPDTIVIDHGSVFVSGNFRDSCRYLGISIQPARLATGSDKPHIERMFSSIGTMFCTWVAGYVANSVERRGRHLGGQPLWSMLELQELLDEWLIAVWQNRPHDGLRDPGDPARKLSPNQKYAALIEASGYVPVPLGAEDYIELLPTIWRAVNAYGIKINHRTYDSPGLDTIRQHPSGVPGKKNLWEIHHDPCDVSKIHVRGRDGWITCMWRHLERVPVPFGELAWEHARRQLAEGGDPVTEQQIAGRVAELLRQLHRGPGEVRAASQRDRRVAARTAATALAQPAKDKDAAMEPPPGTDATLKTPPQEPGPGTGQDAPLAKVIPLGVFDPFEEATKRW
jgi:hypothetical protein